MEFTYCYLRATVDRSDGELDIASVDSLGYERAVLSGRRDILEFAGHSPIGAIVAHFKIHGLGTVVTLFTRLHCHSLNMGFLAQYGQKNEASTNNATNTLIYRLLALSR